MLPASTSLVDVLRRAADSRLQSVPEELAVRLEGSFVWVREREVAELVAKVREELGTTAAARERFRMDLLRRFYEEYGRVLGGAAIRNFDEVERALRAQGYLDRVLKAAWPIVPPEKLVRSLLSSKPTLAEAADGILDDAEQRLLIRRGPGWSDGDVALLDEAHALVGTPPRMHGHVIVDEAQDLTPMQLRMIARRARSGSLTILGDVAQATGAIAYTSWDDVLPHLELGLADAALRYEADSPSAESLEARLERDLDRGATGAGPHLDDVEILAGARDLRTFGSQGEQRLAVLALLLAEAELVRERRGVPPLLLLDDVLSELDPERRRILAERLPAYGQALITTASAAALPVEPNQLVEVEAGEAGTVLR